MSTEPGAVTALPGEPLVTAGRGPTGEPLPPGLHWRPDTRQWVVRSHDLADAVLRDPHIGTALEPDRAGIPLPGVADVPSVAQFFELWYHRGANHPTFSRALRRAYAPSSVGEFVDAFADLATARAAALPPAGDLVAEFIEPFCLDGTFRLMGFPPSRWPALAKIYKIVMYVIRARFRGVLDLPERSTAAFAAAMRYLRQAVEALTAAPAATPLAACLRAYAEAEGPDPWADVATVAQLLAAGVPQVSTGIGVACHALYGDRALLASARAGGVELTDVAEEAMRLSPPFLGVYGWVTTDCDCLGVRLRPRDAVVVDIAAVNLDPDRVPEPTSFCPGRSRSVNITFGKGAHYCLGAASARMQVVAGLAGLVGRWDVHPDVSGFRVTDDGFARTVHALPYRVDVTGPAAR
ncbi:cytochrome P450 [Micromonospora sp. CA-111912]|uniref:cytochrome P450 n=1 Tax=Micromonospora sp. CA-111912 TaxID=3239955 RepID=UPI003D91117C